MEELRINKGKHNFSLSIFVCAAITKHHRLSAYKQQKLVSHNSGSWKSEITEPVQSGFGKGQLQGSRLSASEVEERAERKQTLSCLFIRALTNPTPNYRSINSHRLHLLLP